MSSTLVQIGSVDSDSLSYANVGIRLHNRTVLCLGEESQVEREVRRLPWTFRVLPGAKFPFCEMGRLAETTGAMFEEAYPGI